MTAAATDEPLDFERATRDSVPVTHTRVDTACDPVMRNVLSSFERAVRPISKFWLKGLSISSAVLVSPPTRPDRPDLGSTSSGSSAGSLAAGVNVRAKVTTAENGAPRENAGVVEKAAAEVTALTEDRVERSSLNLDIAVESTDWLRSLRVDDVARRLTANLSTSFQRTSSAYIHGLYLHSFYLGPNDQLPLLLDVDHRQTRLFITYAAGFSRSFDDAFAPEPPPVGNKSEDVRHSNVDSLLGTTDAVEVLDSIKSLVGLPMGDVLAAADVRRSSYYSWREPHRPCPRVSSERRLWELAQLTEDLRQVVVGDLGPWLRSVPARRDALRAGKFQILLEDAITDFGTRPDPIRVSPATRAGTYAVGGDDVVAEQLTTAPATGRKRLSRPVQPGHRPGRDEGRRGLR